MAPTNRTTATAVLPFHTPSRTPLLATRSVGISSPIWHLHPLPLMFEPSARSPFWWRVAQRSLAAMALLAIGPILMVTWALVKGTSKGPFIFRQVRRGYLGRPFVIWKIRTLRKPSENDSKGTSLDDVRVTAVGRVLRYMKIDELPQLWNVVRGDMELVGPRPVPLALEDRIVTRVVGFMCRYAVRPGLTNPFQIITEDNSTGDALIQTWKVRFKGDERYIRKKSASGDIMVVLMTLRHLMNRVVCIFVYHRRCPSGRLRVRNLVGANQKACCNDCEEK